MSKTLKVGDKAPEFSLESGDGKTVKLKEFKGKPVILYFNPKDNTSGCTKQACDFRDTQPAIKKAGAVVLGVSPDSHCWRIPITRSRRSMVCGSRNRCTAGSTWGSSGQRF